MLMSTQRLVATAASMCFLAACSGGSSTKFAPTADPAAASRAAQQSGSRAAGSSAFAQAAQRAPFTLADYHGAVGAYIDALISGGYLAPQQQTASSWLDRAAFEESSNDGDDSESDATSSRARSEAASRTKRLVYTSNFNSMTVDIFPEATSTKNQAAIGQIALPNYPLAIFVDLHQHLYIAAGYNVFEYTRKSMPNPVRTITLPHSAEGIAVTPDGTLYAASFRAYQDNNNGIYVVPKKATANTTAYSNPNINNGLNIATDASGDLFFVYTPVSGSSEQIGEYIAGSSTLTPLNFNDDPSDVQIDASGNLVIASANGTAQTATLDLIPSGSATIASSIQIESKFDYLNLDHKPANNKLYLVETNSGTATYTGLLYAFSYPAGKQIDAITNGNNYFKLATSPVHAYGPQWLPK